VPKHSRGAGTPYSAKRRSVGLFELLFYNRDGDGPDGLAKRTEYMYFWNDKKLAEDLTWDIVSQRDELIYYIVQTFFLGILATQTYSHSEFSMAPLNIYQYIYDITLISMLIIIPIYCYRLNGGSKGKNFLKRITCLSFPIIFIKGFTVAVLLIGAGFYLDNPNLISIFTETFGALINELVILEIALEQGQITQNTYNVKNFELQTAMTNAMPAMGMFTLSAYMLFYFYILVRFTSAFKTLRNTK
jgi:hypothetical protein